ncbi:uncharacterized protein PFL1_00245 [Pseudozyma flocculosa PF-1]|uniref:Related to ZIM17 - Zinc finger Motif protein, mitochondrial n=1 Tax=Pseudozyma flocculosa TaxID=84751 RepID=A0A5C3ETN8_9BASI|nr:uncharacterized protein PFL1_00245 [Pseudozyma flocculosa PF-1]EPQ32047.1 hypothetical protein PFL1_00245 [Pseudozyma flocculosa PF-1]SPO35025.1 related to ZIM17 - Zinc finger Motif protein, mitochondrial [Pseudozyma flocculosa]
MVFANVAGPQRALARSLSRNIAQAVARPTARFSARPAAPPSPWAGPASWTAVARGPIAARPFHSSPARLEKRIPELDEEAAAATQGESAPQIPVTGERTPIGQIQQRLSITFTCSVDDCGHRSTHEFAKRSYTHGIVIVQCPGCKNRHLIADNLSWFTETADEPKTVEEMVRAKGGKVKWGDTIEIE